MKSRLLLALSLAAVGLSAAPGRVGAHPAGVRAAASDPRIAAAGDIACDPRDPVFKGGAGTRSQCRQRATAALVAGHGFARVLALGDTQYDCGSLAAYRASFDRSWGRFKRLIRPAVGNHEYKSTNAFGGRGCSGAAAGYYAYFGAAAGPRGKGYYSFEVGRWHLVALNSECEKVGGCGAGSPQVRWLRADLARHPARCTLAYWHRPRFSSGHFGNVRTFEPFWAALYAAHADVVLVGHDHGYERFDLQTPGGALDRRAGIREFVVGTGGEDLGRFEHPAAHSQRRGSAFGVLSLTLHPDSYSWRFLPVAGFSLRDAGTTACH